VGRPQYRWMKTLGNRSIITKRRRIEIADPNSVHDLLEYILQAQNEKRRVLFFCSCEYPGPVHSPSCHRAAVANLLLKAAHSKGVRLTVAEWPGDEPIAMELRASPEVIERVLTGQTSVRLPKLSLKEAHKFAALPWCSRVRLVSKESSIAVVSGPAKLGREWYLPILSPEICKETDTLTSLNKTASHIRRVRGYTPRS
jgi:hypothetical protein